MDGGAATQQREKFEKLMQRDKEMSQYIDNFDQTRAAVVEEMENTQNTIVALLEDISRGLDEQHNVRDHP